MKRLKNLGWMALVFFVAILLYPLSLNVASLHSDLVLMDQQILRTKREISFLQAELRTRASMQQLEEWNKVQFGYAPPTPEQFLEGETALANLGGLGLPVKPVVVTASVAPAGTIGPLSGKMPSPSKSSTNSSADRRDRDVERKLAATGDQKVDDKEKSLLAPIEKPVADRTEKLARIDDKLLSDDLMRDIGRKADAERKRR